MMEDDIVLPENRTETERLLAAVWNYEDRSRRKSSLPRWLFALTLAGTVLSAFGPSDVYTAVTTALTPAQEKPTVDAIAAANVAEDIDYRLAQHAKSSAGWNAFLQAHPDGPHAEAAQAEIERLLPAPPAQPVEVGEQFPPPPATTTLVKVEPQSLAPPAPPPAMVEKEPARPVQIVESQPARTPEPVMVMREPAPPPIPVFAPPVFAREGRGERAAAAVRTTRSRSRKSVEPANHGHRRAEHCAARRSQEHPPLSGRGRTEYRPQASQTNVFAVLGAQLFHPHRRPGRQQAVALNVNQARPQRLDRDRWPTSAPGRSPLVSGSGRAQLMVMGLRSSQKGGEPGNPGRLGKERNPRHSRRSRRAHALAQAAQRQRGGSGEAIIATRFRAALSVMQATVSSLYFLILSRVLR